MQVHIIWSFIERLTVFVPFLYQILAIVSQILKTTNTTSGPLLTGSLPVVSGATYDVKIEVQIGDLDGDSREYVNISIDSQSSYRCTPTGTTAGSCNWYDCSGGSDLTATSSSVNVRLQYGSGYDSKANGSHCQVEGVTAYAAARITFTPSKLRFIPNIKKSLNLWKKQ